MYNENWMDSRGRFWIASILTAVDWFWLALSAMAIGTGGLLATTVGALAGLRGTVVLVSGLVSASVITGGLLVLVAMVMVTPDHADPPPWGTDDEGDVWC